MACTLCNWNTVPCISLSTGVGTLSVTRARMIRSQNGRSSLSTDAGLSFIMTKEFRGTPPQARFHRSQVTIDSSS
jgi:hypothetical protein